MTLIRRSLAACFAMLLLTVLTLAPASAQQGIDASFTHEKIDAYGFPELEVTFNGTSFETPAEVTAGYHTVVLTPGEGFAVYADFMQVPDGLAHDEAVDLALQAGAMDVTSEGWTYGGGSYTFSNMPIKFVVNLTPGEWHIAASYMADEDGAEEFMELYPLTVAEPASGSPMPVDGPTADVIMTLEDVAFGGLNEPVAAGSTLFEVRNTGEQPRQMVLFRTDRALTSDDFGAWFAAMESGTPPAVPFAMTWVGYAALTSPGYSTWIELDLEPGTYTATSWVVDPETGMPALLLGMVQSFEVV
jgi:hypothetical protein